MQVAHSPAKKAKRSAPKKHKKVKRQSRPALYPRVKWIPINFQQRQWYILPERAARIPDVHRHFFFAVLPNLEAAQKYLFQTRLAVNPLFTLTNPFQFDVKGSHIFGGPRLYSFPFIKEMQRLIRLNKRMRMAFHRLLQVWRFKRLRQANEDDLLTTEPPKDPIWICDWAAKCKYVFEARTLYKDIMERISFSDELFVAVKPPRNPFTNAPLETLQLALIMAALRQRGITSWQLEGLRSNQYCINQYKVEFDLPLRLLALDKVFKNPVSAECIGLVHDFVDYHHELHGFTFDRSVAWAWYLEKRHRHPTIRKWRETCYNYYRLTIIKGDVMHSSYIPIIQAATLRLLMESTDELYLEYIDKEL